MTEEMIPIVDKNDEIIDIVPRSVMRAKNLRHRSTFIIVLNPKQEILICKRTKTKDVNPGLYEVTGGTVSEKETYEENARRETEEELGIINPKLEYLFDFAYEGSRTTYNSKVFRCVYDGKITPQKEEVESFFFIVISGLEEMIEEHPQEFCSDRIPLLKKYFEDYLERT